MRCLIVISQGENTDLQYFRPNVFALHMIRLLATCLPESTPKAVQRQLANWLPNKHMQKLREIVATMEEHSKAIFASKKQALEKGDKDVVHQMEEGKDILSILSELDLI